MVIFSVVVAGHGVYRLSQSVAELEKSVEVLSALANAMERAQQAAHVDAIEKSMKFAPKGYTVFQLRGLAQTQAQQMLDQLTDHYNLPRYWLNTTRFVPVLRDGAAGIVDDCEKEDGTPETSYTISLNEILFLRNYNTFMYEIIPHEVSHIITCLNGGFDTDPAEELWAAAHGEEWVEAMLVLGILVPEDHRTHRLNLLPVAEYQRDFFKAFDKEMEGVEIEYTEK